ncbi:shikimate dehydrogenase family protein [Burkholderia perseverans]|uniref:shikimate dehydrogenase family protein n=1 Tax=Burkholderia perseverans TaxID=2615214 RepID=UPI001FEF45B6|nr:shikimate dehydrogenase [Burkholderia perseverans]
MTTSSTSSASLPPIDGDTRWVAIVADPVAQVQSPRLFNAFFASHGVPAALLPAHVHGTDLGAVLDGLKRIRNLAGVVITVPHKIEALRFARRLSPRAQAIGSINCLRRTADGEWEGDNFDGEGFVCGLDRQGHAIAGATALLVGAAGGAGIALADALARRGIVRLDLHDLRRDALAALIERLARRFPRVAFRAAEPAAAPAHALLINASPAGMRTADAIPIALADAAPGAVVADLIMKPERTALLADAQARGLRTHAGRHLLENAVEPIAAFLGLHPQAALQAARETAAPAS